MVVHLWPHEAQYLRRRTQEKLFPALRESITVTFRPLHFPQATTALPHFRF